MKYLNKKGSGVIYLFFAVLALVIIWSMSLAPVISDWGTRGVEENSLTGIEAFFLSNINLVIFLVLLLVIIAVVFIGGSS